MTTTLLAFIIVLGVLIFFHELGHFLVARLFGVGVEKFSLGFGPRIIGKKKGITDYRISAIPLGGYVKMVGEEPNSEIDPDDIPISFTHKHVLKRICIVAAGPLFNLLLAVILLYIIFQISGLYILKPAIGKIEKDSPAYEAGLKPGDEIVAIGDTPIDSWEKMAKKISGSGGKPLSFTIQRETQNLILTIRPEIKKDKNIFGEAVDRYIIGITSSGDAIRQKLNPIRALFESVVQTYNITKLTLVSIVKLIQGTLSLDTLGGPIMIADLAGKQAKEGIGNLAFFTALLSVNLGILNFLPIPVLDGGHLLFFIIELMIGRPVNQKVRERAQQIGLFILIFLMILVIYNDVTRITVNWFN